MAKLRLAWFIWTFHRTHSPRQRPCCALLFFTNLAATTSFALRKRLITPHSSSFFCSPTPPCCDRPTYLPHVTSSPSGLVARSPILLLSGQPASPHSGAFLLLFFFYFLFFVFFLFPSQPPSICLASRSGLPQSPRRRRLLLTVVLYFYTHTCLLENATLVLISSLPFQPGPLLAHEDAHHHQASSLRLQVDP